MGARSTARTKFKTFLKKKNVSGGTGTTKSTGRYYLYENIDAWTFSMAGTGRHSFDFAEQSDTISTTKFSTQCIATKSNKTA